MDGSLPLLPSLPPINPTPCYQQGSTTQIRLKAQPRTMVHLPFTFTSLSRDLVSFGDHPPDHQLLTKIYPFYMAFQRDLQIVQVGELLEQTYPQIGDNRLLSHHFVIRFPTIAIEFEAILDQLGVAFLLE